MVDQSTAATDEATQTDWHWTNEGAPPSGFDMGLGVTVVQDLSGVERPYAFVRGGDGNMWVCWWTGSEWKWSPEGQPTTGISKGLGAITVRDSKGVERPYVFVRNGIGEMWRCWWTGSEWKWSPEGQPPNGITQPLGAITIADSPGAAQRPYVFVRDATEGMWTRWWTGSDWKWSPEGRPPSGIAGPVGAINVRDAAHGGHGAPERPYVFVYDNEATLWTRWWGNDNQWHWSSEGQPTVGGVTLGLGALTIVGLPGADWRPYAFVRAGDHNMWVRWWNGSEWFWTNADAPPTGITAAVGAVTIQASPTAKQYPYVFVLSGNGNLWLAQSDGTKWSWTDQGGSKAGITDAIGAVAVKNSSYAPLRPYAFVRSAEDNLLINWRG